MKLQYATVFGVFREKVKEQTCSKKVVVESLGSWHADAVAAAYSTRTLLEVTAAQLNNK